MANIYEIDPWANSTDYKKNDIVWWPINRVNYYWYALVDHTSSSQPSLSNGNWAGVRYSGKISSIKPSFFWKPSYNLQVTSEPKVASIRFGDGYEQRIIDGINNILLRCSAAFELRDKTESRAISHFLATRAGTESFLMTLPEPYDAEKLYICRRWNNSVNFYDNYSIKMELEEVTE
tara:strand:+ start:9034 stop:9564 length:531 start_codon:yes stop_codon:yes gene_type:complete